MRIIKELFKLPVVARIRGAGVPPAIFQELVDCRIAGETPAPPETKFSAASRRSMYYGEIVARNAGYDLFQSGFSPVNER